MTVIGILATIALVHLIAAASPGPNLVIVSSYAAAGSRRLGLCAAFGILLGTLTWSSATALGLAAVLAAYPALYATLQYAGAAYLVWLGLRMIASTRLGRYGELGYTPLRDHGMRRAILTAWLVNLTNPKTVAYYSSLFLVMIPADSPKWLFAAAVAVALSVTASWWSMVAMLFSFETVRLRFAALRRPIDALMGSALVLLGVRLAIGR